MADTPSIKLPAKSNILPSVLKQSDEFNQIYEQIKTEGSPTEQKLLEYIKQCIDVFYNKRIGEYETSDIRKLDQELLFQFGTTVKNILLDYMKNNDSMATISGIVKSYYESDDANKNIISEISAILKRVLVDIAKGKVNAQILNKVKINDIIKQINEIGVYVDDKQAKNIVTSIFENGTYSATIQKNFNNSITTYRDSIVALFKEEIFDSIELKEFATKQQNKKEQSLSDQYNRKLSRMLGINSQLGQTQEMYMNQTAKKHDTDLSDMIILYIAMNSVQRQIQTVKKVVNTISKLPTLIVRAAVNAAKKLVNTVINLMSKGFTNLILKPLHFVITTTARLIMGSVRILHKTIKTILDSKLKYALLTPQGMYALGFAVGFIWTKLKKVLPDNAFSIDGIVSFMTSIAQGFMNVIDFVKNTFDSILERFPKTTKFVKDSFQFFKVLLTEGWDKAKTETVVGSKIYNTYKSIVNNPIFKAISTMVSWVIDMGKLMLRHPIATATIFGGAKAVLFANNIVSMFRTFGGKVGGEGLLGGLVALGASMAVGAVVDSIFKPFNEYTDEQLSIKVRDYADIQDGLRSDSMYRRMSTLSHAKQNKFNHMIGMMDDEYAKIEKLRTRIKILGKIANMGTTPGLIDRITGLEYNVKNGSLFGIDKDIINNYDTIKRGLKGKSTEDQQKDMSKLFGYMTEMLDNRLQKVNIVAKSIGESTDDTFENSLDWLMNDEGEFNQDEVSRLIRSDAERNRILNSIIVNNTITGTSWTETDKSKQMKTEIENSRDKYKDLQTKYVGAFSNAVSPGNNTSSKRVLAMEELLRHSTIQQRQQLYNLFSNVKDNTLTDEQRTRFEEIQKDVRQKWKEDKNKHVKENIEYLRSSEKKIGEEIDKIRKSNAFSIDALKHYQKVPDSTIDELISRNNK